MESRSDFEGDPTFVPEHAPLPSELPAFFGAGWEAADPNQEIEFAEPVLINAPESDEFDPRHADDIEGLLYLGHLMHNFDLLGHNFTIRTLRAGERLSALSLTKEYEDTLGLELALKMTMVAASVELVDRRPLYAALSADEQPVVRIMRQFEHVQDWYDYIIDGVYNEYGNLVLRQKNAFDELRGKSMASRRTP